MFLQGDAGAHGKSVEMKVNISHFFFGGNIPVMHMQ